MNLLALLYPMRRRRVHPTRKWLVTALAGACLLSGCDFGAPPITPTAITSPTISLQSPVALATTQASPTPQPVVPTDTATRVSIEPTATPQVAPTETRVEQATPTSTVAATYTPTKEPPTATHTSTRPIATFTPPASQRSQIVEIASGFGSPDDLVVAPSGDILFGDFANNAVNVIKPGQPPVVLAGGLHEPEGMVIAKDGAIILAEQGTNRILEIDQQTGRTKLLRQLVNNTGKDGVDGLGIDPATDDILIPDSPNGRLLRMSRDGTKLTTLATGFVRPTGAAVEPGGTVLVADEFGNAVYRLNANGTKTKLATMYQPDDVIVGPDGSIYANGLGGDIVHIDPVTRKTRVIVSGLKLPHGLGMDSEGWLVVAEAGRNRIFKVRP